MPNDIEQLVKKVRDEYEKSAGELALTKQEFQGYFKLNVAMTTRIMDELLTTGRFKLVPDQLTGGERFQIHPKYKRNYWLKSVLVEEEAEVLLDLGAQLDHPFNTDIKQIQIEQQHIVGLKLLNQYLKTIPESLGELSQLRTLDLQNNQLISLPKTIGKLIELTTLDLEKNQLTTLPEEIGKLTKLKYLYLKQNNLTTLPSSLTNLSNLKQMTLDKNLFEEIEQLKILPIEGLKVESFFQSLVKNLSEEVMLKVADAKQRDIGRGKIRMDEIKMLEIGVTTGDIVEIWGRRKTGAIVCPAYTEDQGAGIVRMDGIIRRNAQVSLEENVRIRKAPKTEAKTVNIAPTRQISLDYGFEAFVAFVKRKLLGFPVSKNDTVLIPILGRSIPFIVNATTPAEIVIITDRTRLNVLEKPLSEKKGEMLGEYYKDRIRDWYYKLVEFSIEERKTIQSEIDTRRNEIVNSVAQAMDWEKQQENLSEEEKEVFLENVFYPKCDHLLHDHLIESFPDYNFDTVSLNKQSDITYVKYLEIIINSYAKNGWELDQIKNDRDQPENGYLIFKRQVNSKDL